MLQVVVPGMGRGTLNAISVLEHMIISSNVLGTFGF